MKQFVTALLFLLSISVQATPATLVYNVSDDRIVSQQGDNAPRPIASLSKIMTAMVVLDSSASLSELLVINNRRANMMNSKAVDLNLPNTQFIDPSGLSVFNISTPREVKEMFKAALQYDLIRSITILKEVQLPAQKKKHAVSLVNTNFNTLSQFKDIVVSKTGFTNPAGFCMGLILNRQGHEFIVVVLGEKNKAQRAATVNRLMKNL